MRQSTNYIVVHCSASRAKDTHVNAKEIDRWHRQRGWLMIGYHFVITRQGVLETGRNLAVAGAHVKGHNHHSVGICLVGGVAEDGKTPANNFTDDQMKVLTALLVELRSTFPTAKIVGHWELEPSKACPVFDIAKFRADHPELEVKA